MESLIIYAVFWLFGFFFLARIPYCTESAEKATAPPSVSIIIPARNEERALPLLLASIKVKGDGSIF